MSDEATALYVDRLTKVYADGTHALDALELRLPEGSFFGLLGPNGAGKTTLSGSVAGLVRASAGRIFVFGHDAVVDARARLVLGLAPQEIHLDRFLTAREVLVYHGRYFGMRKRDAEDRVAIMRGSGVSADTPVMSPTVQLLPERSDLRPPLVGRVR